MGTLDFNVDLISEIRFRPSYHDKRYVWKTDLTQIKYKKVFFGLISVKDGIESRPESFYEWRKNNMWSDYSQWDRISDYEFERCPYIIKEVGTPGGVSFTKEAWRKSYVEVRLVNNTIGRYFDTDDDAKNWIDKLKIVTNKRFETIEIS